ncbi:carbohydrate ABC transporter permease [Gorillibacterium sp. sgz5001074]|uniref:carbohydrate ABC transporter permease n=1 Tax=Gorillibacterium sp. sgz5001074 TaxID=3446695 RepID=UPI003F67FAFA
MGGSWMSRQSRMGYLFILPNMLGVIVFFLIPAVFSLGLTMTNYQFANPNYRFIGLDNFTRLFADEKFIIAIKNTLLYLAAVPVSLIVAFLVAVALNRSVFLKSLLRSMYFMPYITSGVAVYFVWMLLFQPSQGPINGFLRAVGIDSPPGWFASTDTAMFAFIIIAVWATLGYNMIIYMAALQEVSPELLEAARIDGARTYTLIRHVIWPLVSPTTFLLLITGLIGAIKGFGVIYAITQGGPGSSTTVMSLLIYKTAFSYYEMGYASAISWVLFAFVLLITLVQWYGQKKWVHY